MLLLQRKPKLGRTKPSTGQHAARGLDIAALNECVAECVNNLLSNLYRTEFLRRYSKSQYQYN